MYVLCVVYSCFQWCILDGEVVVAVQTADGTRVQSTFHSSASLWDVLTQHKFDSSPDGMEPSLSYMRQEVYIYIYIYILIADCHVIVM